MRAGGGRGGQVNLAELPMIGGKANSMDLRNIQNWHSLPLWQREQLMQQVQQRNAEVEKQEAARRKQELAEKTAAMSIGAKPNIESVPLEPNRIPSAGAIQAPNPVSPLLKYRPDIPIPFRS